MCECANLQKGQEEQFDNTVLGWPLYIPIPNLPRRHHSCTIQVNATVIMVSEIIMLTSQQVARHD